MEKFNKLQEIWTNKLSKGEDISITDLYQFSKIKLKRSRMRKKFNKYYDKYVSKEIKDTYWGIVFARPLLNSFKIYSDLGTNSDNFIHVTPIEGMPKVKLYY